MLRCGKLTAYRAVTMRFRGRNTSNFTKKSGGQDGIRTHETGTPPTPLAGERLQPLGHLSTSGFKWLGLRLQVQAAA